MSTTVMARNNILGRLRSAPVATLPSLPDVKAWFDSQRRNEDLAQRVLRLRAAMQAVKTEFHDVTPTDWPDVLLGIAAAKGIGNLLLGSNTPHGNALKARALGALQLVHYEQPIEAWRDRLFDGIDASLTSARSAVAEIGSIILWPTPSEPRLMSLVPHIHFVLLE
ncbi:MAG: LUD domain-containing protein, partial [Comamonadaceae bacterium]